MKLKDLIDWALIAFIALVMLGLNGCGGGSGDRPQGYSEISPRGVTVRSSSPIEKDLLPIIDAQLESLFRIAEVKGYRSFDVHPSYGIRIEPRDARCDEISFMITREVPAGTQYDGTEFDNDPRPGFVAVCAAGQFQQSDGLIRVTAAGIRSSAIVRYEGEHKLLYQVDRQLYEATKIHGTGEGHPILGD